MGRNKPDLTAGSPGGFDALPYIKELQHAVRRGHCLLADRCEKYRCIATLAKVATARNPKLSAYAICLQDAQT
eukprot:6530636-Lingulodinium_polyedra.AAC.1